MGFDKCVKSCIHHVQSNFTALKILCLTYSCLCTFSRNLNNHWLFVISIAFVSPEYHLVGTVNLVAFPDWLISLLSIQFTFVNAFLWLDSSIIFLISVLLLFERESESVWGGAEEEGERIFNSLHAQQGTRLTWGWISCPWDHDLSQNQELDA